ncbi:MAG: YidC/Oxa1 family membrane protein insertase [Actinomycetota bacterium]|nr:YidC/Oxa1 family membrane protein insertase [Actinomycetota bacterium]
MISSIIPGLDVLSKGIAYVLWGCNKITGNFGLAIVLVTLGIRAILLPLTIKQTKSMIQMQKIQPKLKEVQKKHKDDREKMGQEMMKLYKEHNVSPLGGCLPLILQLPIIFAVFEVLRAPLNFKSIIGEPNLMFIGVDVTKAGSFAWQHGHYWQFILFAVLTIVTGYVSSKQMLTDPKQSKMMLMMPLLMGVFAWTLPIGVTVYIVATNVFTIAQQFLQLEIEGFYKERIEKLRRQTEPDGRVDRFVFRFRTLLDRLLVWMKIRKPPKRTMPAEKDVGKKDKGKATSKGGSLGKTDKVRKEAEGVSKVGEIKRQSQKGKGGSRNKRRKK